MRVVKSLTALTKTGRAKLCQNSRLGLHLLYFREVYMKDICTAGTVIYYVSFFSSQGRYDKQRRPCQHFGISGTARHRRTGEIFSKLLIWRDHVFISRLALNFHFFLGPGEFGCAIVSLGFSHDDSSCWRRRQSFFVGFPKCHQESLQPTTRIVIVLHF